MTALSLNIIAQDKKPSRDHKWQGDAGYNPKTEPEGMVMMVIPDKNIGGKPESDNGQDGSSDQFPFPCDNQKDDQDKRRDQVHKKAQPLLGGRKIRVK